MEKIREYYDNQLDYLKDEKERHRHVFKSFNNLIPKNSKVLDVGCGTGITSAYLAYDNRDVVGIDISPVLIEYARTWNSHWNRVKYIVGDISTFYYTGNHKFDAITMVDVLEHIPLDRLVNVFGILKSLSHKDTFIYLNIPSYDVAKYFVEYQPEKIQIVDNAIETSDILKMFANIDFIPIYINMYWGAYMEYLFVTKDKHQRSLEKSFKE